MTNRTKKRGQSSDLIRLPYFDWDKTKYFYYISKLGSFLEAGRFLNISQSALSRKIAALEAHINAQLFFRQSRGVDLTPVGKQLFTIVERTFHDMREFTNSIAVNQQTNRVIRIASTETIINYLIAPIIFEYNQKYPDLCFELIAEKFKVDVAVSNFDIAIRPFDEQAESFVQLDFLTMVKKIYASKLYLEKFGEPKTVEDLSEHRLISTDTLTPELYPYADVQWLLKLGLPKGKLHKPFFASSSAYTLVKAAAEGLGIVASYGILDIVRNEERFVNILPDVNKLETSLCLTFPDFLKDDPIISNLTTYLIQKVKELQL